MAKLTNVKYPNEVVEIEGVQYRKVDREAKAGDIVKVLVNDYVDVEKGAFYSVITEDGATGFFDDDGDFREGDIEEYPEDFEVYEKLTEPAAPEYREVNREAKVGERIKIINAGLTLGHYVNGDEFEIIRVDRDGDVRFIGRKGKEFLAHTHEYVVLEPVNAEPAPQPNRRLTVGDYAKVIANEGGHKYDIGSVVKIVIDDRDGRPYKGERADGTVGNWLAEHEVIPATEAEFNSQKRLNVGDYAKVVGSTHSNFFGGEDGEIVVLKKHANGYDGFKCERIDGYDYAGNPWALSKSLIRATESEVEAAKKAVERAKNIGEFADGGYAVVVDVSKSHCLSGFKDGDYVTVKLDDRDGLNYPLNVFGKNGGYCNADALRKVTREEYEEATKPKPVFNVGDYARVIRDNHEHRVGHIVQITEGSSRIFDFAVKRITYGGNGFIDAENIEKISAEEVARVEEEAKWAAIGRKVGEFKVGDIAQVTQFVGLLSVGTVGEVGEICGEQFRVNTPERTSVNWHSAHSAKLIVPVEQRFDRAEGGASRKEGEVLSK